MFGKLLVEVGNNELVKCVIELAVLSPAKPGALLWKVLHLHNIGEQDWICAIGETQEVIEALSGGPCSSENAVSGAVTVGFCTYF